MPIYEFYCTECHRIFSFLSPRVNTDGRPACPRCGRADLQRRPSAFAISKNRPRRRPRSCRAGFDEARLEQAMSALASEGESLEGDDPVASARVMRRLFESAGLPLGEGMREALRRMESGEDPEKVEAELGDTMGDDPFAGGSEARPGAHVACGGCSLRTVDPNLYEM